jgi:enterochelin esterase-like enzyme
MRIRGVPFLALLVACGSTEPPGDDGSSTRSGGAMAGGSAGDELSGGIVNDGGGAGGGQAGSNAPGGGGTSGGAGGSAGGGTTSRDAGAREGGAAVEAGSGLFDAGTTGDGDFTISAPFHAAPEVGVQQGVPQGTLHDFTLSSMGSAVYPVDVATKMPFSRNVSVYVPKQYVAGTAAPFIVVQDGISFYRGTMVPVLDNMIQARRLPVMIAIFVEPGPNENTPNGERSFEYDSVSDAYVRFVETELLPKIEADYKLSLTADPEGRAAMGGSSGGAAAFTMGWFRPDLYHRILTYSGSFCDLQPSAMYPDGAWTYHESLIANTPVKPLRVALEVGDNDLNWNTSMDMKRNWRPANLAMAAALAGRGYHYRFVDAKGAGHIDSGVLAQTLPDTLAWLWQGYPVQ